MRPPLTSTLLAALPALLVLLAGGCGHKAADSLALLPLADIGPQISRAKGPEDQPAVEVIAGPSSVTIPLVAADVPAKSSRDFVIRGKLKEAAAATDYFELLAFRLSSRVPIHSASHAPGDWQDFELTYHGNQGQPAPRGVRLNVVLAAGSQVTVAETLVVAPLVQSGDEWEAQEPVGKMRLRSPDVMGPRVAKVRGPAGQPAIEVATTETIETFTLAVNESPGIASSDCVLSGRVRYRNPASGNYLELVSDFGEKGTFSTRTSGDNGPNQNLDGTSEWRVFELPIHVEPGIKPQRLTLKVSLQPDSLVAIAGPLVVAPPGMSGYWPRPQGRWWTALAGSSIALGLAVLAGILWGSRPWGPLPWGAALRGAVRQTITARPRFAIWSALAMCGLPLAAGLVALCAAQP